MPGYELALLLRAAKFSLAWLMSHASRAAESRTSTFRRTTSKRSVEGG
jgi:hypothetical protein